MNQEQCKTNIFKTGRTINRNGIHTKYDPDSNTVSHRSCKAMVQAVAVTRALVGTDLRSESINMGPKLDEHALKQPTFDWSVINMQNSETSDWR